MSSLRPEPNKPADDAALSGTDARLRSRLLDEVGQAIITTDSQGKVLYWNRAAERLYGWSAKEAIGRSIIEATPSEELMNRAEEIMSELRAGRSWSGEFVVHRKDDVSFPAMATYMPVHDKADNVVGFVSVLRDIAEHKRTEETLRESQERFRRTFNEASIGMAVTGLGDGRFLQVNRSLCEILGPTEEELLASTFLDVTHPDDVDVSLEYAQRLLEGELGSYQIEKRYLHAEGHPVWLSLSASVAKDSEGRPLYFIAQMQDVTERKRADEALKESEGRFRQLFQLSVAAVFGILLLRKPLQAFVKRTVLRPFSKPSELVSNLLAVSLAAQIATAPIIATSFEEVSVIGVLTNLVAVPLSGPILTLGLLGTLAGNVVVPLAYLVNASNGFLVTILAWVAEAASTLPFAAVGTPGATLPLVGLFYLGCLPAAIAEAALPEEGWPKVAGLLLAWAALWITLVAVL